MNKQTTINFEGYQQFSYKHYSEIHVHFEYYSYTQSISGSLQSDELQK